MTTPTPNNESDELLRDVEKALEAALASFMATGTVIHPKGGSTWSVDMEKFRHAEHDMVRPALARIRAHLSRQPGTSGATGEPEITPYMEALLCIGHWDLHHHSLLAKVRSLLVTRREFSANQSAVLSVALDELAEAANKTAPAWPKSKPASPTRPAMARCDPK